MSNPSQEQNVGSPGETDPQKLAAALEYIESIASTVHAPDRKQQDLPIHHPWGTAEFYESTGRARVGAVEPHDYEVGQEVRTGRGRTKNVAIGSVAISGSMIDARRPLSAEEGQIAARQTEDYESSKNGAAIARAKKAAYQIHSRGERLTEKRTTTSQLPGKQAVPGPSRARQLARRLGSDLSGPVNFVWNKIQPGILDGRGRTIPRAGLWGKIYRRKKQGYPYN